MTGRSLRVRLLALAGVAIGVALAVAWAGLSLLFERHAERQLTAELAREGAVLASGLALDAQGRPTLAATPPDPRFLQPGGGLYWRVAAPGGEQRSRSLWDGRLPAPPARVGGAAWSAETGPGPFEPRLVIAARYVRPTASGPAVLIEVAEDHQSVSRMRNSFAGDLALFLVFLWAVLVAASWAQVRLGLAPLKTVAAAVGGLARDPSVRLEVARHPKEVAPLAEAINALAEARAQDVVRARARAQDLAHALKTPLTALRIQAQALSGPQRADIEASLSLLSQAVGAELARAQLSAAPAGPTRTPAAAVVDRLWSVLARAHAERDVGFERRVPPDLSLPMAEEAALEAFGGLLDNAARHARARIVVTGGTDAQGLFLSVADDGPGIPAPLRARSLDRGARLQAAGGGQGLGLAIAADFIEAAGGRLTLSETPGGGLTATARWPADGTGR